MRAKYVMTNKGPILFGQGIPHDVFRNFSPKSAGFVLIDDKGNISTYGKSESLGLQPAEYDKVLIEIAFEERNLHNDKMGI